ncbi:MAG: 3'-5' exonuclease domain-containing protein 2 [Pseudodesulfovibrio sp.]|uniref:3'-5' exonuclease n=1 Tax=Pseudodesulfovibrio aespoeensis (strain ATCC 700646 / DSM 10631 / Aspo-2) TaxID=643562 RepID=E6VRZ8_PSEA9|nr:MULTISPECIES: 3'-5' exonuclease [Pseudodesulfovibrio]MBU4192636.1 3'-5' exonuclease domain-containing protein 2 [Pseudomonadota bacterium]ADU61931.1 3'-5' exonuclease [Pseudodesulfovibrio aespoeensis Aspo-2]MBU4379456.1 3'-5' exonuclease domain-containing protein 2 [Pseudomonadota bacterium]MBU4514683.1 3'-5' exonuclease domain-containing protein 2 [Pseudomonadota bacterium]MBU4522015.1 3'-5' exonuclease domain-containing protein 2 [Pseudomonadota bacterium]
MTKAPTIPEQYLRLFTKEEINAMPLCHYEGPVAVVRTEKQRTQALREMEGETLLGFDTETRPVFKKGKRPGPPSLIQLATASCVYVFQINLLPLCNGLCDLLADKEVIKTGVAVRDDILGLQKMAGFTPQQFIDLSDITAAARMQTHGLRNMAANLLGFRISKSAQCSNWAKEHLTPQQITYAATDAWISRELYLALARLDLL